MAQGHIRKGFFFYFGLFVLVLFAAFMICLVVMMFNPGKTVLWMQYFTGDETIFVDETTDDSKSAINIADVDNVVIDASISKVTVVKNKDYANDGIYIINKAKGFAGAKSNAQFSYSAKLEGSTLKVSVTEPNGFLYLSKDLEVVVFLNSEKNNNLNHLNLTVKTETGNVYVGETDTGAKAVYLKGLNISTTKGNVYLRQNLNTSDLQSLSVKTNSGDIYASREIVDNGKAMLGLEISCNANFETEKGTIAFDILKASGKTINIVCDEGITDISRLYANEVRIACFQGNFRFGSVYANVSFNDSANTLLAPNLIADYIQGNFTISGGSEAKPDINVKKIDGLVNIVADNGSVIIKEAARSVVITSYGAMKVELIAGASNTEQISIRNKSGDIKLGFKGVALGNVDVKSESSKSDVTINFLDGAVFTSEVKNFDGSAYDEGKITLNLGTTGNISKNPLTPNNPSSSDGKITLNINGKLTYNKYNSASDIA
ncbi:MAG: hypothetical protein E7375_03335 [Clostridiales bacterium]|nr:hypothetical protein [Clostridiales bacterium]